MLIFLRYFYYEYLKNSYDKKGYDPVSVLISICFIIAIHTGLLTAMINSIILYFYNYNILEENIVEIIIIFLIIFIFILFYLINKAEKIIDEFQNRDNNQLRFIYTLYIRSIYIVPVIIGIGFLVTFFRNLLS